MEPTLRTLHESPAADYYRYMQGYAGVFSGGNGDDYYRYLQGDAGGNGFYFDHTLPEMSSSNILESEFSRLTVSGRSLPPAYDYNSSNVGVGSSIWNPQRPNNGWNPQWSNEDINGMRVQSAARLYMEGLSNINGGNNNSGRSLNVGSPGFQPRNGFNYINGGHNYGFNRNNVSSDRYYRNGTRTESSSNSAAFSGYHDRPYPYGSVPPPRLSILNNMRGQLFLAAKHKLGCRILQEKIEEGRPRDIHLIFTEIKDHICELMTDQLGNYLVQKIFGVCSQEQITQLLCLIMVDALELKDVCCDTHGTRAMQKFLEHLTTPQQQSLAISVLKHITVDLTKNTNGHHVIQQCLRLFSVEDKKQILNVIADNCLTIATDKSGCCVLQQCVNHAMGEPRQHLIAEITSNALILSEHPYGNYVVQYILGLEIPHVTADIMKNLSGSYVSLSMNKYGSNVVEKCLSSDADKVVMIIDEIMTSGNFLRVLQDPYGNYVVQSALAISPESIRLAMAERINSHYQLLHSHPHGKRVLANIMRGSKQQRA